MLRDHVHGQGRLLPRVINRQTAPIAQVNFPPVGPQVELDFEPQEVIYIHSALTLE